MAAVVRQDEIEKLLDYYNYLRDKGWSAEEATEQVEARWRALVKRRCAEAREIGPQGVQQQAESVNTLMRAMS
jgi:TPP-dependent pyruvate/acetoin dehydrogenase alpha subunit